MFIRVFRSVQMRSTMLLSIVLIMSLDNSVNGEIVLSKEDIVQFPADVVLTDEAAVGSRPLDKRGRKGSSKSKKRMVPTI
uniref:Secreted protein n=1 Tax=Schistosoma mansoni TaxID=6183 RepID=A0A5K4F7H4_SCHMA